LQATQKKFRKFSVQPGLRGSNDLRVGQKVATFQLFFQSGRVKDLSAPLYWCRYFKTSPLSTMLLNNGKLLTNKANKINKETRKAS